MHHNLETCFGTFVEIRRKSHIQASKQKRKTQPGEASLPRPPPPTPPLSPGEPALVVECALIRCFEMRLSINFWAI